MMPEGATKGRQAAVGAFLFLAGALGLLAAVQLALEKYRKLADADYVPSCDLNPVLSCGSVITTPQAEAFGFPNPILGIVGFTVVIVLGVLLAGGTHLGNWVWIGLNIGSLLGFAFVNWLAFQSLYVIGALCPWCLLVWAVTAPIFFVTSGENLRNGRLGLPADLGTALGGLQWIALAGWYFTVAALIFLRWQDYWLG